MKVSEAIDQLKAGDTVWVKGMVDVVYPGWHPSINIREVGWFNGNTEISLTEPKNEKVEVNEEQVRLLKKYENEPLFSLIGECRENEGELLARARLCGYTFNPKRWVVMQGGSEVWYLQGFRNSLDGDIVKQWCIYEDCIKFTDKSKAEAVATLVEGSVEEV